MTQEITRQQLLNKIAETKNELQGTEVIISLKYVFGVDIPSVFNRQFVQASLGTGIISYLGIVDGGKIVITIENLNQFQSTVDVKLQNLIFFNEFWSAMQLTTQHLKSVKYKIIIQKIQIVTKKDEFKN